jgi:CheY-like chemotaxis protein
MSAKSGLLKLSRILVVEDNSRFREGANKYLSMRGDIRVAYATNYDEAIREIYAEPRLDGAIIDCFFPKIAGSGDLTFGHEAIKRLIASDPRGRKTSTVAKALTKVGDLLGGDFAKFAAKNTGVNYSGEVDNYWALEQAMKESESNQPLGILVAERAGELGVSFILATSTYHHDELTQPIQDYASRKGWRLVDCGLNSEHEKETPEFWARAFGELKETLRG